ncbi:IS4-like element ISBce9 family transposase (plasmid) [Bacillus cereus]|uniref:Transposase for insertion sequence element IS231 n=1 Tax=Bacillus cereus (strain ZK / E33L) TaxID=288681 RepID=Q4V1Y0_BACCZ|nr:IS4-like element ISBce9 family transposase [Bacillus cereus]AAY60277.1 transposase for insertion sequence element IS231 [Bacillus cereus E33L]QQA19093.1 IS4-like element ISBce9 family transposase [Bacillus cereus]
MNMNQKQELSLFAEELYRYMSPATLNQLAIEAGGMKRKRKCHGHHFLSLCVWLNQQVATTSLTQLCSQLETSTGVLLSPEGLNRRFNSASVAFFRTVFTTLLQAKIGGVSKISHSLSSYFERIRILDSTTFQVPDRFAAIYPGAGGCSHKAGVKIEPGKRSDQAYGATRTDMIQKNELYIRDLGYFRLQDFKSIQDKQGYYLSRLKLPTKIYRKEFETVVFKTKPPQLKPVYTQIHLENIMKQLQPGQVYELHDVYVGSKDKLPTRIVVYRCTEEQKQKRLRDQTIREKKKGITYTERTKLLQGITVYMTNIPTEWVPKEKIYALYSLRWQIELLFKIWKSWFQIHRCKSIKQERLECHLYGQLISILFCSSTMFKMREFLLRKKQKELSEYKAMYIIKDYFSLFYQSLHKNTQELSKVLLRLFNLLQHNGQKSHRYEKKTVFDILGVVYEYTTSNHQVA